MTLLQHPENPTFALVIAFELGSPRKRHSQPFRVHHRPRSLHQHRRKNLAGSLIAHDNYIDPEGRQGIYTMEFWPTAPVAFRFVEKAFCLIAAGMPFLDGDLAYHPAGETQRALHLSEAAKYGAANVRTIFAEELFGNVTYTALNPGECFGRLRLIGGAETVSARDIVILTTIPNDLTHVAGILTKTTPS